MDNQYVRNFKKSIIWKPNENPGSYMKKLQSSIENKYSVKFVEYWDFHKWSVEHLSEFWAEVWEVSGVIYSKPYKQVVDISVPMETIPKWFIGAELNFAENLLKYRNDTTAIISAGEDRETEKITYAEMFDEVELYSASFRKLGIGKGDVVICYMSNRKEAILTMLSVIGIGAIFSGVFPQLGTQAVLNRITQVKPKAFVTVDRFLFNKKEFDLMKNIKEISDALPTLKKVIIVPSKETSKLKDISNIRNSCFMDDFLEFGRRADGSVPPMKFEQVPLTHPILLSFTSGTTGLPKPLMHGSGVLLAVYRDFAHLLFSDKDNILFSVSPVGWTTWNMMINVINLGQTLLLYEGLPYFISPTFFWDLIDEFKISHTFMPTSVIDEFNTNNFVPKERHSLSTLELIVAGGSVVKPSHYDFMYNRVKGNFLFTSHYGSTELMAGLFGMEHSIAAYRGELSCFLLGCSVECLDTEGKHVLGEVGELVISKPMPNSLLGLWGDENGSKYREIYFSKYPGKFFIGDQGIINPLTKGLIICGRSDDTLKQRGNRFGSSEIYYVVDTFPEVVDSLCVPQYKKDLSERAVLFIKMRDGYCFDDQFVNKVRKAIAAELTPDHVPDIIIETTDIPYNTTGKKMELLIKNIINERPYNSEPLLNPDSLQNYKNRKELRDF